MDPLEQTLVRCLGHEALHLILIPSEACDVRCAACPDDSAAGRMRPEVVRGIKNLLTDRAEDLGSLTLSWSGGEPLVAQDVIEDLLEHVMALRIAFPDLAFQSDVTTNAHLLTPVVFGRLRGLGVDRFQVPIEGPAPLPSPGDPAPGRVTPDSSRSWANLRALRWVEGDFVVEVRALVADKSDVSALVEAFRFVFDGDERFRLIVRRPLVVPGGRRPGGVDATSVAAPPPSRLRSASPAGPDAFPDAFVVRADGRIVACAWPRRTHPSGPSLGHLGEEGRLHLDPPRDC